MATYAIPNWNIYPFLKKANKLEKADKCSVPFELKEDAFVYDGKEYFCTLFDVSTSVDLTKFSVDGIEKIPAQAEKFLAYRSDDILALAFYSINRYGFKNSSQENATKVHVKNMYGNTNTEDIKESSEYKDFLNWILNYQIKSDFERVAKEAINSQYCKLFTIGFICAFVNQYFKEKERKVFNSSKNNDYIGQVGETIEFECVEAKIVYTNQPYAYNSSVTSINQITDKDGHIIIWSTSQAVPDHCYIRATVKAHKEYKGLKETVITRGKIYAY